VTGWWIARSWTFVKYYHEKITNMKRMLQRFILGRFGSSFLFLR
jgi:hypothetical protein